MGRRDAAIPARVDHNVVTGRPRTPGPHRIRRRCSGPVCDRPSASRPVPYRVNRLQAVLGGDFNGTERTGTCSDGREQGRSSADGCGEDRAKRHTAAPVVLPLYAQYKLDHTAAIGRCGGPIQRGLLRTYNGGSAVGRLGEIYGPLGEMFAVYSRSALGVVLFVCRMYVRLCGLTFSLYVFSISNMVTQIDP